MPAIDFINITNGTRVTNVPRGQMRVLASKGWREATDEEVAAHQAAKATEAEATAETPAGDDGDGATAALPSWASTPSEED